MTLDSSASCAQVRSTHHLHSPPQHFDNLINLSLSLISLRYVKIILFINWLSLSPLLLKWTSPLKWTMNMFMLVMSAWHYHPTIKYFLSYANNVTHYKLAPSICYQRFIVSPIPAKTRRLLHCSLAKNRHQSIDPLKRNFDWKVIIIAAIAVVNLCSPTWLHYWISANSQSERESIEHDSHISSTALLASFLRSKQKEIRALGFIQTQQPSSIRYSPPPLKLTV